MSDYHMYDPYDEDEAFNAWWSDVSAELERRGYEIGNFAIRDVERYWDDDFGPIEAATGLIDDSSEELEDDL